MAISVRGPRILIKQDRLEDVNPTFRAAKAAGLAIPDHLREVKLEQRALDRGTVLQVGSLAFKDWDDGTPWCAVGDKILYARHAGKFVRETEDDENSEEFVIINDEDVIAVLKED